MSLVQLDGIYHASNFGQIRGMKGKERGCGDALRVYGGAIELFQNGVGAKIDPLLASHMTSSMRDDHSAPYSLRKQRSTHMYRTQLGS